MLNYSCSIKDKKISKKMIPSKDFDKLVSIIAKDFFIKDDLYFDVCFVDKKEIQRINKKYRKINKPTDVITFAFKDQKINFNLPLLGEIYICIDVAKQQAKENKNSLNREICLLFVHGILHLFQIDHQTQKDYNKVVKLQQQLLDKANI